MLKELGFKDEEIAKKLNLKIFDIKSYLNDN